MELNRIAQEIRPVLYQAGHIALRHFRQVTVERKPDYSYVTAGDREVETFIREEIHRRFPDHGFYGEESGHHRMENADYVWAIDPIDGTAPFVYEFPIWCVSVGLLHAGEAVLGFVYLPVLDELYWAIEGGPAYMNREVLKVHEPCEMSRGTTIVASSATFRRFKVSYRGRALAFGSAAANHCFVARGKVHGGIQETVRLYDIAASAIILKQAGGVMKYLSGREVNLGELLDGRKTPEMFASGHPNNVDQLIRLFAPYDQEPENNAD